MARLPRADAAESTELIRRMLSERRRFAVPEAATCSDVDVVLRTSGSSAVARGVGHTFEAVTWAAQTSRHVLGDPGWRWLLLLSPFSAGGFATVVRSEPAPLVFPGIGGPFDAAACADWYPGGASATSLVSTQLARLIEQPAGVRMLSGMRAVLVGGGPLREGLRQRCEEHGIPVVSTFGATETLGGCVYDGVPWPGVRAGIVDGQIVLDGPNLALTYVPGPRVPRPWPTGDLGRWDARGRLQVLGRTDERITVKGVNRHLWEFEQQALSRPGVVEAVAVAVPDDVDGYRVEVFVEDAHHRLPRLESGKPDRQELIRRASGHSQ